MKEDYSEVVAILDMSGSMGSLANDTICGFNTYLQELQKAEGEIRITLITFSNHSSIVWNHRNVKECQDITSETYHPSGGTALTDALGDAIENMKQHIKHLEEEDKPGKVSFFVSTDGQENASRSFNRQQVREEVVRQTEEEKWEFIFAGANIDAFATGQNYGIQQQNIANIHNNGLGQQQLFNALA